MLPSGPIVSAFSNKFGCRTACICGGIIGTVAFLLSTFSTNSNVMMLTYGFFGGKRRHRTGGHCERVWL